MAAIDFPNSPTVGDIFTAGNSSYRWTGEAWVSNNLGSIDWDDVLNKPTTFAPSAHTHAISDVTSLQTSLDGKAASVHTHVKADVTDFAHTHLLADITDYVEPDPLPSQTGNAGKYLTTNGSVTSWGTVDLSTKQDVVAGVSSTEIGYLDGVTSAIQTQIDGKAAIAQIVEDKTTNYTIVASDRGKIIRSTGASATTFTIADVLATGESIDFIQSGDGLLSFAPNGGTVLSSYGGRNTSLGKNARFRVTKSASGAYILSGDLDALKINVEYLVVAGGGGGGNPTRSAGGGAGGYRTGTIQLLATTNYQVSVGGGGAIGGNGTDSIFASITSTGGGAGAAQGAAGANGGSGGGGTNGYSAGLGNVPATTPSQGNNGGGATGSETGGGGGGADAAGSGQTGGAGRFSSITGSSVARAGGGGGGGWPSAGPGGVGGGGNGGSGGGPGGTSGAANTGGGGGGGPAWGGSPGAGGSGVVILSYPSSFTINLGAGLTGTTATVGANRVTTITAGAGNVSWA